MSETTNTEAMVQDQNLNSAPNAGTDNENIQKKDMFNTEDVELPTIGKVPMGEEPAKEPANTETQSEGNAQTESEPNTESPESPEDGTTETTPPEAELPEDDQRKRETEVYFAEVERVLADPRYHAMPLPGGKGVILNLTAAVRDGIELSTPSYNRAHGKDKERTAKSIGEIGLQHPLMVATSTMADAAGMPVKRFSTDPKKDRPLGPSLTIIDGNGRIEELFSTPLEDWPDVYAVFPSLNTAGQMDLKKVYVHININVATWGGPDFLVLKVMEPEPHEAWTYIKGLQDKGYGHTASNVLATLKKGNITKTQLTKVDLDEEKLFERFESAKKIHAQLIETFGEDNDVLKTKQVPEEMVDCLQVLVEKDGIDKAVETVLAFLKSLTTDEVKTITGAKGKAGASKHVVRVSLFHNLFNGYIDTQK